MRTELVQKWLGSQKQINLKRKWSAEQNQPTGILEKVQDQKPKLASAMKRRIISWLYHLSSWIPFNLRHSVSF